MAFQEEFCHESSIDQVIPVVPKESEMPSFNVQAALK